VHVGEGAVERDEKRSVREARVNLAADRRGSVQPLGCGLRKL
jgi:hypothetical protein